MKHLAQKFAQFVFVTEKLWSPIVDNYEKWSLKDAIMKLRALEIWVIPFVINIIWKLKFLLYPQINRLKSFFLNPAQNSILQSIAQSTIFLLKERNFRRFN